MSTHRQLPKRHPVRDQTRPHLRSTRGGVVCPAPPAARLALFTLLALCLTPVLAGEDCGARSGIGRTAGGKGAARLTQLGARSDCKLPAQPANPMGRPQRDQPLFRFGVIADVQYADKETQGKRRYRESSRKLQACVADLNQRELAFVVNLGDTIDGHGPESEAELGHVVGLFDQLKTPVRHVIGNHCLEVDRPTLMRTLRLKAPYYEFRHRGWRFLVLDGMDVSVKAPPGSPAAKRAREYLARTPDLPTYNGALGEKQLRWLKQRLSAAHRAGERVLVFCHHPSLIAASSPGLTLWNRAEVLRVIEDGRCVAAYFCGHDHQGGYARQQGIHHLTMQGMVEAPSETNAYAVVEVFPDRLVLQGVGTVPHRELALPPVHGKDE